MKVWIVETEIMTTWDEWSPQDFWRDIEKIFDDKDKAIFYVQERIKNAIDEQRNKPDRDVRDIIDHVPTAEEILKPSGCWYKTIRDGGDCDYCYEIHEYVVE